MHPHFQKPPFPQSTLQSENAIFKFIHFGERFQKALFSLTKTTSQCGRKAKTERKIKRISVDKASVLAP